MDVNQKGGSVNHPQHAVGLKKRKISSFGVLAEFLSAKK